MEQKLICFFISMFKFNYLFQSCQTVIEYKNNKIKILFKGCKNPTANAANEKLGCKTTGSKTFCREKCVTDSCNYDHNL
jgi:hypothetical protein